RAGDRVGEALAALAGEVHGSAFELGHDAVAAHRARSARIDTVVDRDAGRALAGGAAIAALEHEHRPAAGGGGNPDVHGAAPCVTAADAGRDVVGASGTPEEDDAAGVLQLAAAHAHDAARLRLFGVDA